MAEPKRVTKTFYNTSDGPRSIALADGGVRVIGPGDSAEVEVFSGEVDNPHPDLTTTKPKPAAGDTGGEPKGSAPGDQSADAQARAIEELATDLVKGHDMDGLKAAAKAEKVEVGKDDSADQIALAIAQKRLGENK